MLTNPASETAPVYTDFQGLARLRAAARADSPEALEQVARQFEAYFLQQLLRSGREAGFGGGVLDSAQTRFYEGLFDQQVALTLSQGKGIGLAELLVQQIQRMQGAGDGATGEDPVSNPNGVARAEAVRDRAAQPLALRRFPGVSASRTVAQERVEAAVAAPQLTEQEQGGRHCTRFDSPEQFVNELTPHAIRAAAEIGVDARLLLAQAALETGWGRSVINDSSGRSSHNLFGIKADPAWEGPVVTVGSLEFEDGVMVRHKSAFRSYESYADSFRDYLDFLRSNPRYGKALEHAESPEAYARELQRAGYATDPHYADKILGIYAMDVLAPPAG